MKESWQEQLQACLERIEQAGERGDPRALQGFNHARRLLDSPQVAVTLVRAVLDSDVVPLERDIPELQLLEWLLLEARQSRENDNPRGIVFLAAAQAAIEAREENIPGSGALLLARTYHRAEIEVPSALLQSAGPEEAWQEQALPVEMDAIPLKFTELLQQGAGDPYQLHAAFSEAQATVPVKARAEFVFQVAGWQDPTAQRLACYWLLDDEPSIREAAARGLFAATEAGTLEPETLARLPMLRSWLPAETAREQLDRALKLAKQQRPSAAPNSTFAEPDAFLTTLPDGVGAQSVMVLAGFSQKTVSLGMLLLKAEQGTKDAYILRLPVEEAQVLLDQMAHETGLLEIQPATLRLLLSEALAQGHEKARPPAHGLIDVVEMLGWKDLHPQPMTTADWLAELDPQEALVALSPQKRGRLINQSETWPLNHPLVDSWFENNTQTRRILETTPGVRKRAQALRAYLEERRDAWALQMLRTAAILRDTASSEGSPDEWRSFAVTAQALLEGRELRRIPIMEYILEVTTDAFDAGGGPF